ncbi:hypothetical protein GCM10011491_23470 [Brucella endophytica]|uniref:Uncharacterized protein n=1 Tax=Brucella endophytica TaxID=1963359 RepID=A0A916WG43_9HYPH|nr:hypothetical protein [Brucella endophytica]GGA94503.1 hypothetical protein GCM10011491_23470 [Brucella endophytica]
MSPRIISANPACTIGKISEVAVRDTIHDRPIGNDTALANPACLEVYRNLPALRA